MKNKYGIVSLKDLSKYPNIYIRISKALKKELNKKSRKKYENMKVLGKSIKEKESQLISFFWNKSSLSLSIFLKLVKILKIKKIEKDILWIGGKTRGKGIKNPKLPFNFNSMEGGKFIASVLGDGCFHPSFEISYRNYCPMLLKEVIRNAKKLFGNVDIICEYETEITFPSIIGKIIKILGLKQGRKTVTDPCIPDFIMNGPYSCKIGFLKQISDDEGSVQINPPYSYSIRYEFAREIPKEKLNERKKYVPNLLLSLYKLFRKLGFSTTSVYGGRVFCGRKKKDRRIVSWAFDVLGKTSLEKFAKEINFRIPKRKKRLKDGLRKMKVETYGRKAEYIVLMECKRLCKENGYVTKHILSKRIKRTRRNAEEWLKKLERKGFLKINEGNELIIKSKGFCGLSGRTPFKFKITKNGLKFLNENKENKIQIKISPKYKNIKEPIDNWR